MIMIIIYFILLLFFSLIIITVGSQNYNFIHTLISNYIDNGYVHNFVSVSMSHLFIL